MSSLVVTWIALHLVSNAHKRNVFIRRVDPRVDEERPGHF